MRKSNADAKIDFQSHPREMDVVHSVQHGAKNVKDKYLQGSLTDRKRRNHFSC